LELRQKPGPENALGLIKFNMPNKHSIYIHGSPSKWDFDKARRDLSHSCIRVQDPLALAAWALRDRPEWTLKKMREVLAGKHTVPAFTENLRGVKVGEVKEFPVTYAEDYPQKTLAGKTFSYKVEVQSIKKKVVPPADVVPPVFVVPPAAEVPPVAPPDPGLVAVSRVLATQAKKLAATNIVIVGTAPNRILNS